MRICTEDFEPGGELAALEALGGGGVASFTGLVRDDGGLLALQLDHYSGMTERQVEAAVHDAASRWPLLGATFRLANHLDDMGDPYHPVNRVACFTDEAAVVDCFGASAVAGAEGTNWLAVAIVVSIACVISGVAAMTAKETKDLTLAGIDDLHTTRTEAAELARLDRSPSSAGTAR